VVQEYEARVSDTKVLPGNTAVLNCQVPSFFRDFLTVTSWLQDQSFNIYPTAEGGEYRDTAQFGETERRRCVTDHRHKYIEIS
jgi:hypothetical protein